jgi:arrestin (S-antigen)-like protein
VDFARDFLFLVTLAPAHVARVWFEGLPDFSTPGGSISGTLGLEADGVVRAKDLLLYLHGTETAQITVGSGKSRQVIIEKAPFLELVSSFHNALPFTDADHVGAGTYRFPFRFDLPAMSEPSLATEDLSRTRGRFDAHPDGMYVEYELEARLEVPWWVDPLDREVVPVFSPRRVLGALPPFSTPGDPDRPSVQIRIDQVMILPGSAVTGSYSVDNPRLKELPQLNLTLLRHVEFKAKGYSGLRETPQFSTEIPLPASAPHYEGRFQIPVPNTSDTTGPFTGQLYRTYWVARVDLEVRFGFNVRLDAVFTPA